MKRKAKMMKLRWNQMETHKKANRNINGRVEYDQYNPNLKKMKLISGKDGAENCYRPTQSKSQC